MRLTHNHLEKYIQQCRVDGQNTETIKVKHRNLRIFFGFCAGKEITPELLSDWRKYIAERYKTPRSRNAKVCNTNVFLEYLGLKELRIKSFECNHHILYSKKRESVTIGELKKMLAYTEKTGDSRTHLLLRTLALTGIRSGEIQHITVEAVKAGYTAFIHHKQPRKVLLPDSLCRTLREYADSQNIISGPIFLTRNGLPVHPRNIGTELKQIAEKVGIPKDKINPTAFRILFANTYYEKYDDLSGLTDLLGVKDLNMTVLYVKENNSPKEK